MPLQLVRLTLPLAAVVAAVEAVVVLAVVGAVVDLAAVRDQAEDSMVAVADARLEVLRHSVVRVVAVLLLGHQCRQHGLAEERDRVRMLVAETSARVIVRMAVLEQDRDHRRCRAIDQELVLAKGSAQVRE